MNEDIMKELYKTFKLSTRQGSGNMVFKYVPNEDVINRMNTIFKGNWSTEVKSTDIVDDQVVAQVLVSVVDPNDGVVYHHTGFGSQQIMRYNSGTKQGKVIDIGNGYKGALAKAIVNACTRWGVGLFKESNPLEADAPVEVPINVPMPSVAIPVVEPVIPTLAPPLVAQPMPAPNTTAAAPMPVLPTTTAAPAMPMPPTTASPTPSPYTIETTAPAVSQLPEVSVPTPMPPVQPPAPPVVETTTTFSPPIAPEQPVSANISLTQVVAPEMPKLPTPAVGVVPTTPELPLSKDDGLSGIGISDVQKVALNGILTMNNAEYVPLAEEAFAANNINKPVPEREKLNYEEAVVVIKFGNDKYRKNR